MTMKLIATILLCLIPSMVSGIELGPSAIIGISLQDRMEAWPGHIDIVVWLDNDTIVYTGGSGLIRCYSLKSKSEMWRQQITLKDRKEPLLAHHTVDGLTIGNGSVFVLDLERKIHVFDGATGKTGNKLDWESIAVKLLDRKVSKNYVSETTPSPDGNSIVSLSPPESIRIWSLRQNREIFKMGNERADIVIDGPFTSHAQFDGAKTLIFTVDNSWATGTVHVHDIQQKKDLLTFDSRNGHAEMDVDFASSRIALTGTSENLTLFDFQGKILIEQKKAADQRIRAVRFSPDRKRIAIGSWDNTVRVFEIKENQPSMP